MSKVEWRTWGLGMRAGGCIAAAGLLAACNTLDAPAPKDGMRLVVPTDTRAAVQALSAPPPISGGTLAVDASSNTAVVADPDRDRISLVALGRGEVRHFALEQGDEPGRVVIDDSGRAHVVLRGAGEIASLSLDGSSLERRSICRAPRGIAFEAGLDALHVACAEGALVSVPADPAAGADPLRTVKVPEDVRDVVVQPDGVLMVSRFKRAELLVVDPDGELKMQRRAQTVERSLERFDEEGNFHVDVNSFEPHIAYRMRAAETPSHGGSTVVMLHQGSQAEEVDLDAEASEPGQSPYGGGEAGLSCGGIVTTELTFAGPNGVEGTALLGGSVLPVDLALSPSGQRFAIAQAGTSDPDAPRPFVMREEDGDVAALPVASGSIMAPVPSDSGEFVFFGEGSGRVIIAQTDQARGVAGEDAFGCQFFGAVPVEGQPTAVEFVGEERLVVQSREPATLTVLTVGGSEPQVIALGGDSVADTGHDLFHRDSGAGIACASCHAEGGDDGHLWSFSGIGARRTQAVHVGLEGTEPFHWDGDMHDLGMLMSEVFIGRMGGVHQSPDRMRRMTDWLFGLEPPTSMVEKSDPAAVRGKALFESAELGCAGCHAGSQMTDNLSYHVGTTDADHPLQVPSLRGIAYRAPFLHDGCAETLADRFDPTCGGGDMHGKTSQLSAGEVDDLVMYLKTR